MNGPFDKAIDWLNEVLGYEATGDDEFLSKMRENDDSCRAAIAFLQAGAKVEWKPDRPETTILQRFDEATVGIMDSARQFKNDWIWQEMKQAIEAARALIAALPAPLEAKEGEK